jgi:hypothetical protein
VLVNKRPALRVDDVGIHAACCGTNTWQARTGSETVFIDGRSAHRQTDQTRHCGGNGQLVEGSPNVIVGDTTASPAVAASRSAASPTASSPGGGGPAAGGAPASEPARAAAEWDPAPPPAIDPVSSDEPGGDPALETLDPRAQAATLRAAAAAHMPLCEECERAGTGSRT